MADTVLVTGANGFLGRHLVAELLRRNYAVRALLRPGTAPPFPAAWAVEYVEADLTRPATLAGAAEGCAAIRCARCCGRAPRRLFPPSGPWNTTKPT